MQYRILGHDVFKDSKGNDQAWVHIEVITEDDIWTKAERLNPDDVALLVADASNLNTVAQAMAERAVIRRPGEKAEESHRREVELEEKKLEVTKEEIRLEEIKTQQLERSN